MIHGGLGHLEVARAAAVEASASTLERSLADGLDDWRELQAGIERLPHVLAAAPTIHVAGMGSTADGRTAAFLGLAVDPARERRMGFDLKLQQGAPIPDEPPAPGEDEVLLARGLAETLGLVPGSTFTLLALEPDGMLNALDVRVAGIVTTGVQELDTRYLKLHLATAGRLLASERVSNLVVTLDATRRTAEVQPEIERLVAGREPELAIVDWRARAPFYAQVRNLYAGIFWFLGSIVFVLVVLSTSNTLTMAVLERVRELGTLRAIGASAGQVAGLVMAEAVWLALLGSLAGGLLGGLLIALLNALSLEMPPPPGAVNPIDLRLAYVPEAFAGVVLLMLVVLALAAIPPLVRVVRLRIVEALAHT
jgi:putative ABC transport system permease protein